MASTVELVGGPYDGDIRSIPKEDMVIRFIALAGTVYPMYVHKDATVADSIIKTVVVEYLKTKRYSHDGYLIYRYVPPPAKASNG